MNPGNEKRLDVSGENRGGPERARIQSLSPLQNLLLAARSYPILLIVTSIVVFALGLVVLAVYPKSYEATALITPPSELDRLNVQSGLSGSAAGGSLAALAGFSAGPQSATQTRYETFVTLLSSRRIAAAMIRDHDALRLLYANRWDPVNRTWKRPSGLFFGIRQWARAELGYPGWAAPDASTLAKYMEAHLKATQSLRTTQRTLTFSSKSPLLASSLLAWAMQESDAAVREDALERADEQLRYLKNQMATEMSSTENRSILTEIMMGTERSVVLASTGSTFAEQVIQPPETSNSPSAPTLVIGLLSSLVAALASGIGVAMLRLHQRLRPPPG